MAIAETTKPATEKANGLRNVEQLGGRLNNDITSSPTPAQVIHHADIRNDDDFNWDSLEEDAVILREQRATAAYRNRAGELIIRQRATWDEDRDTFVYISVQNEVAFLEGLAKRARG